ncbi:peptidylprolyl isomerase [bacterium]|nr:peptidylprolyl isomerase [bacterium]
MFEALRKMIFPIIVITLLFFVAMIVLEWGLSFSSSAQYGDPNVVAVVNGEEIAWNNFYSVYNNLYQQESQKRDGDVPDDVARQLEDQAFNQMLHDHLLMQQVRARELAVSDTELFSYLQMSPPAYVQSIPDFQTDGRFDYQKYLGFMLNPQAGPFWVQVEALARQDVLKLKVQEMVISAAVVTEDEVRQSFIANNEKVTVGAANAAYNDFIQPRPTFTDEQIRAVYDSKPEDYQVGERRTLKVAMIEKVASEQDEETARQEIQSIYDSVTAGGDFAELARVRSEDTQSAINGGDLGWFPEGQMVDEFNSRAFSMKDGEVSEPFRTQFGWHIIKHHGYRTDTEVPRGKTKEEKVRKAHVSHILLRIQPSPETLDNAYAALTRFRTLAAESGFDQAAAETGIEVKTTQPFLKGTGADFLGPDAEANEFAFNHEKGDLSRLRDTESAFYIAQVGDILPAGRSPFEDVKQRIESEMVRDSVRQRCWAKAKEVHDLVINEGVTLKDAASKAGVPYTSQAPITRQGFLTGIGRQPEVIGAAFGLTTPGQISEPIEWTAGGTVLELIQRESPDLSTFTEKRDSIYTAIKSAKQQELYARWYQKLVEDSEIINNLERNRNLQDEQQASL